MINDNNVINVVPHFGTKSDPCVHPSPSQNMVVCQSIAMRLVSTYVYVTGLFFGSGISKREINYKLCTYSTQTNPNYAIQQICLNWYFFSQ